MDPIHACVVVRDELAELGGDRDADVVHVRDTRQAGAKALDRLELGRPGGHPAEGARGSHGDRRIARERLGGVEVALAPAVGSVVSQVEDAVEGLAVDERDRQQALDPLLDGGGSDRAGRPQGVRAKEWGRPARREIAHARSGKLHLAGGRQERLGESRATGGRDAALRVTEDDGYPVCAEQHPGVVAEVADDVGHVQPGCQVRGDATQRLGAPQAARGLFRGGGTPHQDAQGPGDRGGEPAAIVGTQLHRARDREQAPGRFAAGDRHEQLIGAHAQYREGGGVAGTRMDRLGALQRTREQARSPRDAGGCARGSLRVGGADDEAARSSLPDPDEGGAGRGADPAARLVERGVETGRERGDLREVGQQIQAGRRLGQGGGPVSPDPP